MLPVVFILTVCAWSSFKSLLRVSMVRLRPPLQFHLAPLYTPWLLVTWPLYIVASIWNLGLIPFSWVIPTHFQLPTEKSDPGESHPWFSLGKMLMLNNLLKMCFFSSGLLKSAIVHSFMGLFNVCLFHGAVVFENRKPCEVLVSVLSPSLVTHVRDSRNVC